jgi:hypothetical protein
MSRRLFVIASAVSTTVATALPTIVGTVILF